MGAGLGGMWGGLIGLMTFGLPLGAGIVPTLASLLGGALVGAMGGGLLGALLGVRVPRHRTPLAESRPIVVAVEIDNLEEAERAEADLLNVMGPFRPKILEGAGAFSAGHGPH
jgi:microcystin-dependent protein